MSRVFHLARPVRTAVCVAVAGASLATGACSDTLGLQTQYTNADKPYAVYALTGTPLSVPTALSFSGLSTVRADGSFGFDIAFDINQDGAVVILPVGQVGTPVNGAPLIGLQRSKVPYDSLTSAPTGGYVFDSVMVVPPSTRTLVIQAQELQCSTYIVGYIFAKITVDSIDVPDRKIFGRTLINLNCGSRELMPGIPTF